MMTKSDFQEKYGITEEEFDKLVTVAMQLKELGIPTLDEVLEAINKAKPAVNITEPVFITSKEVEALGISRQRLHYWVKQGYVTTKAVGKQNIYKYQDLIKLREKK